MSQPVWSPSAAGVAKARLTRFIAGLAEPAVSDYPSLYAWSIEDPESFWVAVWRFCGVVSGRRWDRVLETTYGADKQSHLAQVVYFFRIWGFLDTRKWE